MNNEELMKSKAGVCVRTYNKHEIQGEAWHLLSFNCLNTQRQDSRVNTLIFVRFSGPFLCMIITV